MPVEFVQTHIPIFHRAIDEGIGAKIAAWLNAYSWVILLVIVVGGAIWYFFIREEKPKPQIAEKKTEEKSAAVEVNIWGQKQNPPR